MAQPTTMARGHRATARSQEDVSAALREKYTEQAKNIVSGIKGDLKGTQRAVLALVHFEIISHHPLDLQTGGAIKVLSGVARELKVPSSASGQFDYGVILKSLTLLLKNPKSDPAAFDNIISLIGGFSNALSTRPDKIDATDIALIATAKLLVAACDAGGCKSCKSAAQDATASRTDVGESVCASATRELTLSALNVSNLRKAQAEDRFGRTTSLEQHLRTTVVPFPDIESLF
ncbi:MAG: hypothetical protein O3A01_02950 [bacterium]|nr:hypothetical protein [bacterium]